MMRRDHPTARLLLRIVRRLVPQLLRTPITEQDPLRWDGTGPAQGLRTHLNTTLGVMVKIFKRFRKQKLSVNLHYAYLGENHSTGDYIITFKDVSTPDIHYDGYITRSEWALIKDMFDGNWITVASSDWHDKPTDPTD